MQARTLFAATLLPAILSACSDSAADRAKTSSASTRPKQELALTAEKPNEAVASPIETSRPGTKEKTAPRAINASRKHATRPAVEMAMELPKIDTRIHESPATVTIAPAVTDIPMTELPQAGPSVSAGDEPVAGGDAGNTPVIIRRPGIIIRGGGDGLDPCDEHDMRGRGRGPTVLANPRIPGLATPRGGDRTVPTGPSRGGVGGGVRF